MECEHGWRNAMDCDTCTAIRVAPKAMDRIAELEDALRGLVEAVKAGCAVSGAEAMGAAETALANQK